MAELHISDVRAYKSCRLRWFWSSALGLNLEPQATPPHFLIGKAVHFAIGTSYETGEFPEDIFDRYMQRYEDVRGAMWEEERKTFDASVAVGHAVCATYRRFVRATGADDKWRIVDNETPFGPLTLPGQDIPEFTLAGRFDGVIQDKETGEFWLREYKTAARPPSELWLRYDDQVTAYCWAAEQVLGQPIAGVQFRFLMKKIPNKPPRLKNGGLSRAINSPQVMTTTYDLYLEAVTELAAETRMPIDAAVRAYQDVLDTLAERGYGDYVIEMEARRTPHEKEFVARSLVAVGREMRTLATKQHLADQPILELYPSPDWLKCQWCSFKDPCSRLTRGENYRELLVHEYKTRVNEQSVEAEE